VAWNIFHTTSRTRSSANRENTGDEDSGHLRVTYQQQSLHPLRWPGNPALRFGTGNVYNNTTLDVPDCGIASRQNARCDWRTTSSTRGASIPGHEPHPVAGIRERGEHHSLRELRRERITNPQGTFVPPTASASRRVQRPSIFHRARRGECRLLIVLGLSHDTARRS